MYCGHARLRVCLSEAACLHYCTDPDVTWRSGRGCPVVVHYWADLQSLHGLRCYGNTIFQTETEYQTEILQRNCQLYQQSTVYTQCLITCLCWLLGRMQNKYFVNTRTVLGSAIFGSLNHSIFSGKCIVPIPAVLPLILSPLPWIYRGYCGFPIVPIPMQLSTVRTYIRLYVHNGGRGQLSSE